MPLNAQINLPERCYSYLLQEWMDFFSIRETFGEAHLGKGEKRQKKKEGLVGVSYTVDPKVRRPEEVAENLIYPEKSQRNRLEKKASPSVRAQNVRRMASLERPQKA